MAYVVNVAGATLVRVAPQQNTPFVAGTYVANTFVDLGYTRDGVTITFNGFFVDVPTDADGGESGPPSDVQFMGMSANIRIEATKFDPAVMAMCRMRISGSGVEGVPGAPVDAATPSGGFQAIATGAIGQLMLGGSNAFKLLMNNVYDPYLFLNAFPRDANDKNVASKYTTDHMEWFAIRNGVGGALYTRTLS